jgi:hypothetical protein
MILQEVVKKLQLVLEMKVNTRRLDLKVYAKIRKLIGAKPKVWNQSKDHTCSK